MPKKQTYTVPFTLRLSPGMMDVVNSQARKRGVTAVDWVRHAVALTLEEETYLREHLDREVDEQPRDYLADFEEMSGQSEPSKSPFNEEHQVRLEDWRRKGRERVGKCPPYK